MAARWMQSHRDKAKRQWIAERERRDQKAGLNKRWAGCGDQVEEVRTTIPYEVAPCKLQNVELPPHVEVKRIACKGVTPRGGYSMGACRKARKAPVELWTGGKQRANRNHVAPAGRGLYLSNAVYEPHGVWPIVRKA